MENYIETYTNDFILHEDNEYMYRVIKMNALHSALLNENIELCFLLSKAGAKKESLEDSGKTIKFEQLLDRKFRIKWRKDEGPDLLSKEQEKEYEEAYMREQDEKKINVMRQEVIKKNIEEKTKQQIGSFNIMTQCLRSATTISRSKAFHKYLPQSLKQTIFTLLLCLKRKKDDMSVRKENLYQIFDYLMVFHPIEDLY